MRVRKKCPPKLKRLTINKYIILDFVYDSNCAPRRERMSLENGFLNLIYQSLICIQIQDLKDKLLINIILDFVKDSLSKEQPVELALLIDR